MTNWFKRDRGLPAGLDENRLAQRLKEKQMPRVASVGEAMAAGFEPVNNAPGHFRKAHAIWALRKAVDGEGFVLVRLRDEPAPGIDPRRASTTVIVEVQTEDEAEEAETEEVMLVPLDLPRVAQYYAPGDKRIKDDEYVPDGGSTQPLKKRDISQNFGHQSDIGEQVTVLQSFSPALYGDALVIPKGRLFEVSGHSAPNPDADMILGMGFDEPVYPSKGEPPAKYTRIRLQDDLTGVEIAVLPWEFNKFLQPGSADAAKPVVNHTPSRQRAPTVPSRPTNEEEWADVEITETGRAAQLADDDITMDLGTGQYAPEIPRDPRAPTTEEILRRQEEERQMRIDRNVPADETVDLFPDAEPL